MTSRNKNLPMTEAEDPRILMALRLMTPFEKVSARRREWVRLLDAQQSLSSPLYQKKAEALGMEEYFKQYSTSRVR